MATSGISRRRIKIDNKIYGHILNPITGWPVEDPPLSITVKASSCLEAGMLTTMAMLQGKDAEAFLTAQDIVKKFGYHINETSDHENISKEI